MLERIFDIFSVEPQTAVKALSCEGAPIVLSSVEIVFTPWAFEANQRHKHCREARKKKRGEENLKQPNFHYLMED
ncbi:MAG: hypothetical protein IPO00_03005 [Betaproteobacteria bacterium]|nr:hypothetical protein [Betaproteobacteria bacterium]